jgi:hypothetical protein
MEEKSSGSFDSAPVSLNPLNILEALRSGMTEINILLEYKFLVF